MDEMKKQEARSLTFTGVNPTRSMIRYVQRQIAKWIEHECGVSGGCAEYARYRVHIDRSAIYPYYSCTIDCDLGGKPYRSVESGRTLHEAMAQALKHLHSIAAVTSRVLRGVDRPNEPVTAPIVA